MTASLPISKSIANRLLILGRDATYGIPACDLPHDVLIVQRALNCDLSTTDITTIDIEDCGTAMRFLTAYYALTPSNIILTGTERMMQRPIAPLVDALRQLGANINYIGDDGFPPLHIKGNYLKGGLVRIQGNISSQFISALMLTSHQTEYGITIDILPPVVSSPYIRLTQAIINDEHFPLEPDWSAAAFWYEYTAICGREPIFLLDLHTNSWQGDAVAARLFEHLGVKTEEAENGIMLHRTSHVTNQLEWDFTDCPDLYPAVVATCHALGVKTQFSGLSTLRHKESDRIAEMQHALANLNQPITSNDHRIVMALAILQLAQNIDAAQMIFLHPDCVTKSYPQFWQQFKQCRDYSDNTIIKD